jgi:hypothetical protein
MTYRLPLSDDNGNHRITLVFDIDETDQVIESGQIESWADTVSMSRSELRFWIKAAGGEQKIIERALAKYGQDDDCTIAKRHREYEDMDEGA